LFSEVEQTSGAAQLIKTSDQMEPVRSGTKREYTYRLLSSNWDADRRSDRTPDNKRNKLMSEIAGQGGPALPYLQPPVWAKSNR
jgi:hypothetical protein